MNGAAASSGATATAQNYTQDGVYEGLHFQPSYANDGVRYTTQPGDHFWRDEYGLPSRLQIDLAGQSTIDEVDVYTEADYPAYQTQSDPAAPVTGHSMWSLPRRTTSGTGTGARFYDGRPRPGPGRDYSQDDGAHLNRIGAV